MSRGGLLGGNGVKLVNEPTFISPLALFVTTSLTLLRQRPWPYLDNVLGLFQTTTLAMFRHCPWPCLYNVNDLVRTTFLALFRQPSWP